MLHGAISEPNLLSALPLLRDTGWTIKTAGDLVVRFLAAWSLAIWSYYFRLLAMQFLCAPLDSDIDGCSLKFVCSATT